MLVLEILFAALFLATTILEIAMDWKWHDRRTRVHKGIRWTLILFAIASFVITGTLLIVDNAQKRREEGKRRFSGELISESKIIASSKRGIVPAIQIGKDGPRFFNDYLRMWEEMGVEIRVQAGQIKVSTAIRDRHGNIVADIVDNEWRVNPNNVFDRNYSDNALEVKDNAGNVILQMELIDDVVHFQGVVYDSKRGLSALFAEAEQNPALKGREGIWEYQKPGDDFKTRIKPLFKYPSDLHLGERVAR
jgi:hypothetical protein